MTGRGQASRKSIDQSKELWTYLSLSLIVLLKGFKGLFVFSFYVDPDLDILFEKLIAQAVGWVGLSTQLPFETFSNLCFNIIKMQQLTLG